MEDTEFTSGSIFWILFTGIAFGVFLYLGVWGLINLNLKAVALSGIFVGMILGSVLLSKLAVFKINDSWEQACEWFAVGFFAYMIITFFTSGREAFSIFTLPGMGLFASLSQSLPIFWEFFITAVTIPIAEELFWLIGIPIFIFWMMNIIGNTYHFFKNQWFQIFVATVISSTTFAIFHVGKFFISFIIAAIIFRTIQMFFVWGDAKADVLPGMKAVPALALGAHMGNNWGQAGFIKGINVMITAQGATKFFGIFMVLLFTFIFLTAFNSAIESILGWFGINYNIGDNE